MFEIDDNFFKENGLLWGKLVGCATDGARAMFRRKSGFQGRVKAMSLSINSVHCFMHGFAFASKFLPPNLKTSLSLVVKMVNYIKTSALNSRLFKIIF